MDEGVLIVGLFFQLFAGVIHLFHYLQNNNTLKNASHHSSKTIIPITVIIAAHNEAQNLKRLIPKLLKQHYANFFIQIILDRCTDESKEYLSSVDDTRLSFVEIKEVPQGWNEKKYALNHGINVSTTEWMLFTDADCIPASNDWIRRFGEKIEDRIDLVLGVGLYDKSIGLLNAFVQYETLNTAARYISSALRNNPYMGVGRNMAYRKSKFLEKQGFKGFEHLVGGDDDLMVQRLAGNNNTQVVFGKDSLTYSAPKRTWKEYLKQKTRHYSVSKHYRPKHQGQHAIWFAVHASFWLSFLILVNFNLSVNIALSIFVIFILFKGLILKLTAKHLSFQWNPVWIVAVDLIYVFGTPLWTLKSVLTKKIGWN
ncbi:MAG: glycosyltransferase [Cyclobacteriaceae bacterium]